MISSHIMRRVHSSTLCRHVTHVTRIACMVTNNYTYYRSHEPVNIGIPVMKH